MSSLGKFLDDLFGVSEGHVYAPFIEDGFWNKDWYEWPLQREDLMAAITGQKDIYLSPVMYSDEGFGFLFSNVVWADFDSGLPSDQGYVPTWRIQSSPGKEHWYWKLSEKLYNRTRLEDYNKRLSRFLGGDKVAWNYNRVLRPPTSLNGKYSPSPKVVVSEYIKTSMWSPWSFDELPEVSTFKADTDWDWTHQEYDMSGLRLPLIQFINGPVPERRAQGLVSIAKSLHEYGWSRAWVMSLLDEVAEEWGKFSGRSDRNERLKGIYTYAVGGSEEATVPNMVPKATSSVQLLPLSTTSQILAVNDEEDWILKDLLARQGFMIVAASPGVGKTTMALNLMLAMATGTKFLDWEIPQKIKTLFFSLEMNDKGLKKFVGKMVNDYPAQMEDIDSNIRYYNGYSYRLSTPENREKLLSTLDQEQPDGIVFDSLSRISDDINEKASIDIIFDFITEEIIKKRNMFCVIIHHQGKGSTMGDARTKMDKLYGSVFIGAWVDTILTLTPIKVGHYNTAGVKLEVTKSRYSEYLSPVDTYRSENLILKKFEEEYIR